MLERKIMPITLGKNLNLCFTKIKFPLTSRSSSSLLTPDDNSRPFTSAATASSLLFKNYNSLYDNTFDSASKSLTHSSSLSSEPDPKPDSDSEPDFATVFASQRFFFTSPGSSNSIIESTPSTTPDSSDTLLASSSSPMVINTANQSLNDGCDQPTHEHSQPTTVKDSVAVQTLSPNPYIDFRRSMQEMVEARELIDVKANWDYLHELLLCYLALNPKKTHKFIIGAFADLLVSLMAAEGGGNNDGDITEITGGWIPGQCM
ncbi:hypothetical protein REPUB_Repub12eG0117100 [Reevesia pubescens]